MLSIKPVVEVKDGVVEGESRQRTRARSLRYVADKVLAAAPAPLGGRSRRRADDVGSFVAMLGDAFPADETITTYIGPVIGAHTGPGTIGVCFQRK